MATIKDVAKHAGVSTTTVSLAGRIQHCRPDSDNRIPCGYLLSMVGYQLFAINCWLSSLNHSVFSVTLSPR
ncbi:LacI family DNA-binding transcriptional regulator [Yersinia pestis]|uniref:LacI family DNA-binding transcriptional regulator n=1 Tax=Yersinia pestis TaxID=632 RepID=UPI00031401BA|nr:bacterial regulatory s, lacI family protein [Yersinia pestis]AJK09672.1 bacterial regulatory s, lacI family protein [Yersinia pestis]